jgi:hypothetical protein
MGSLARRDFLKAGLVSAALSRPLLGLQEAPRRAKGVIWLWMAGGMSPWETWDPKDDPKVSGGARPVETDVPGMRLSEWLPVCAAQAKRLSIVRTVAHREGELETSTRFLYTGSPPEESPVPTVGNIVSAELSKPDCPLPGYVQIDPPPVPQSALLGEDHLPFRLRSRLDPIPNIRRNVPDVRDRERFELLEEQNREWTALRQQEAVRRSAAALARSERLINTPLLKAFHWQSEPEALRKAYGAVFGENCLLARRLVEAGCAFVEVGMGGWHAKSDSPTLIKARVPELDRALGTLVGDLAHRKLLGDVVVVCATAFGRTPFLNAGAGRDRWSRAFSVVLAGGALAGGRVHGSTGDDGRSCEPPVTVPDLLATVYRAGGIDPGKDYALDEERRMTYGQGGVPIAELFPA